MSVQDWFTNNTDIEGVLLDISGVLYNSDSSGGKAIPGSVQSVKRYSTSSFIRLPLSANTVSHFERISGHTQAVTLYQS